jgi:hypothetical protein
MNDWCKASRWFLIRKQIEDIPAFKSEPLSDSQQVGDGAQAVSIEQTGARFGCPDICMSNEKLAAC